MITEAGYRVSGVPYNLATINSRVTLLWPAPARRIVHIASEPASITLLQSAGLVPYAIPYVRVERGEALRKNARNPRDWRIEDLKTVADGSGIGHDQNGTSHVVFRHAVAGRLSVPAHQPVKPVYVRLFVDFINRVREQNED